MKTLTALLLLGLLPLQVSADMNIFACEPEWAALAQEIGGDLVETYSATTALQDPHYIQARPSLIARVRQADLVLCSGAQLEIGWLPALLQKANNRKVLPGNDGYMEASSFVLRMGATTDVDRAKGDIHPQGNPHIQTNPHNIAMVAAALSTRLAKIDPINSEAYENNLNRFITRWEAAILRWEEATLGLRGKRVITHHKSWVYLLSWLGIEDVAHLEAVPGIPPTAAHLSQLTGQFADGGADAIIRSPYQHAKASEWLSQRTGIPAIVLPLTVGGSENATDLFKLFDDIVERLQGVCGDA
ncbi:MAG: zinc ABC transporter substrate-binding protein [Gammaproteobacteria bacterium]|nr:zinc ABC transporter substrate-binding protein [Gammaproteobacteria bacterium]